MCVCVCLCAYSVDDFSLVCDTGAELEQTVAQQFPSIFNGNAGNADRTPEESFDRRSDNRVRHCRRQVLALLAQLLLEVRVVLSGLSNQVKCSLAANDVIPALQLITLLLNYCLSGSS